MSEFSPYLLLQLVRPYTHDPAKLEYHYMGASEFEWGVVPLLWKTLNKNKDRLVVGEYLEQGVQIFKNWRRDIRHDILCATVDVALYYAAMPVYVDAYGSGEEKKLNIQEVLKSAVHNHARGHEPFYLEDMFVTNKQSGWLSVPRERHDMGRLPPGYLFVAATTKETFDLMMKRIETGTPQ